jgi:hypothetical protein
MKLVQEERAGDASVLAGQSVTGVWAVWSREHTLSAEGVPYARHELL